MHDESVLCVAWSRDSDILGSGSKDGKIKARGRTHSPTPAHPHTHPLTPALNHYRFLFRAGVEGGDGAVPAQV